MEYGTLFTEGSVVRAINVSRGLSSASSVHFPAPGAVNLGCRAFQRALHSIARLRILARCHLSQEPGRGRAAATRASLASCRPETPGRPTSVRRTSTGPSSRIFKASSAVPASLDLAADLAQHLRRRGADEFVVFDEQHRRAFESGFICRLTAIPEPRRAFEPDWPARA